jgi:uncharacterized BrkB/YihY/UPF0761 family membrane protein
MQLPSPQLLSPLAERRSPTRRDTLQFTTAIRLAVAAFRRDNASRFGAALAFYVLFSLAPTLLIAIAVLGLAVGKEQAVVRADLLFRPGADACLCRRRACPPRW